nr:MAG: hypothetical protein [Bacteriophage sp.]
MIGLPGDADGCVIPLDTKVLYDECGNELKVSRYCCSVRQIIRERVSEAVMSNTLTYCTSCLYITPPDSRDKPEEDLDGCVEESDPCRYFNKGGGDCSKCAGPDSDTCGYTASVFKDIEKRIRRLRGEDK